MYRYRRIFPIASRIERWSAPFYANWLAALCVGQVESWRAIQLGRWWAYAA